MSSMLLGAYFFHNTHQSTDPSSKGQEVSHIVFFTLNISMVGIRTLQSFELDFRKGEDLSRPIFIKQDCSLPTQNISVPAASQNPQHPGSREICSIHTTHTLSPPSQHPGRGHCYSTATSLAQGRPTSYHTHRLLEQLQGVL